MSKSPTPQPRMGSIKNKIVSSDLEEERKHRNFDNKELAKLLWNGEQDYIRVKDIWADLQADKGLQSSEKWYDMSREEQMEDALRRLRNYYDLHRQKYFDGFKGHYVPWWSIAFQGLLPFGLSYTMFLGACKNIADDEQAAKWLPNITALRMTGCYAQTELGHGSNVAGIETTATFDRATQEFVINTPTISAIKFWPGDMSRLSNHAVVFAKLIIDGKAYGVHSFMVQTRNLETWDLVPGIEAGDIGPKFGYNSKDNGFMLFKNVRIPRTNMLKRFAEVDKDGKVILKGDMRQLYGIMLETRVWIAGQSGSSLGMALTIAGRYSVVRRQFSTMEGTRLERKLLDYQTHMFKFAPLLAYSFAFNAASQHLFTQHMALISELKENKYDRLDIMHHLTAGYKAVFSRITYEGIDTCRQACGGAGFSAHSGLPGLQVDYAPNTTYEGDNTVMLHQAARLIMKTWKHIHVKKSTTKVTQPLFGYFYEVDGLTGAKCEIKTPEDALNLESLERALKVRSLFKVKKTMELLLKAEADGVPESERNNSLYSVDIVSMAQTHILFLVFKLFRQQVESPAIKCNGVRKNLMNLLKLFALTELQSGDTAANYENGYFAPGTQGVLLEASKRLMKDIRPQMIPLIESWELPDEILISAIGNSYGDIYETQMEWARNSRLNKTAVPKGFEYFRPILTGKL